MVGSISSRLENLEKRVNVGNSSVKITVIIDYENGTYDVGDLKGVTEAELSEYKKAHLCDMDIIVDGEGEEYD